MKKLFVSVPMRNRTVEAIKKSIEAMHKIAEIEFGEKLEVIDSFEEGYIIEMPEGTFNTPVYFLGRSIQKLADADYFIGIDHSRNFKGCDIEREVARYYGVSWATVDMYRCQFLADAVEIEERMHTGDYL